MSGRGSQRAGGGGGGVGLDPGGWTSGLRTGPGGLGKWRGRSGDGDTHLELCGTAAAGGGGDGDAGRLFSPLPPPPTNASSYCVHGRVGVPAGGPGPIP